MAFFTGLCGLTAEIVWSRLAGVQLGFTVTTDSQVLACVFWGLGLGYLGGGWLVARYSPHLIYGLGEILAAAFALLPLVWSYLSANLNYLAVGVVLSIAATAQGLALPAFLELAKSNKQSIYGLNLLGAAFGAFLTIWFVIPYWGVNQTLLLTAGLGGLCGIFILLFLKPPPEQNFLKHSTPQHWPLGFKQTTDLFLGGLLVGGGQVVSLLFYSLIFHNSTYTFTLVVISTILFLALGSAIAKFVPEKWPRAYLIFGGSVFALLGFSIIANWTNGQYLLPEENFWFYCFKAFCLVAAGTGGLFTVISIVLPSQWQKPDAQTCTYVGASCFVSTFASGLGAVAFGLVISNGYLATNSFFPAENPPGTEISFSKQSRYGLVQVKKFPDGNQILAQNFHYIHGSLLGAPMERRQSDLPLLIHSDPKDTLFIGMGTGISAGAALDHESMQSNTVVELIPEVSDAAREFKDANNNLHEHFKTEIVIEDGRTFLRETTKQYDVIVVDLVVPWESKSGYLFTSELYQSAREKLNKGGVFCQWLPLWQLNSKQLSVILNTAADEFKQIDLIWGNLQNDKAVLGVVAFQNQAPDKFDFDRLNRRIAQLRTKRPDPLLLDAIDFQKLWLGRWTPKRGPRNTYNQPFIEFWGPRLSPTFESRLVFDNLLTWLKDYPRENREIPQIPYPVPSRLSFQRELLR